MTRAVRYHRRYPERRNVSSILRFYVLPDYLFVVVVSCCVSDSKKTLYFMQRDSLLSNTNQCERLLLSTEILFPLLGIEPVLGT